MSTYRKQGDKAISDYTAAAEEAAEQKKAEVDEQVDHLIAKAEAGAAEQQKKAEADYQDIVDTAAVQREIDRRQIAETMANMGLTNSGLNATQQTAVQLSAGNKMAAADRQRQAAVDALTKSLQEYKFEAESTRTSQKNAIDEQTKQGIAEYTADINKSVAEAEAAAAKAKAEAQAAAAKNNDAVLKTLFSNGAISPQTYSYASTVGWTAAQAMEYEKNITAWGNLRSNNKIDDSAYSYFTSNGYTAVDAEEFLQKSNMVLEILGTKTPATEDSAAVYYSVDELAAEAAANPNSEAAAKLVKAAKQLSAWAATGALTAAECDAIARSLGFTNEMLEEYSSREDVVVEVPKKYTWWEKVADYWKNNFTVADIFD